MRTINYPCNRDQALIFRRFVHLRFSLRKIWAWGRGYAHSRARRNGCRKKTLVASRMIACVGLAEQSIAYLVRAKILAR